MANDMSMQMNSMFGANPAMANMMAPQQNMMVPQQQAIPQLQNLDFWCELAKNCKDASKYIGQAADVYQQVVPVAGQAWGAIDPASYNAYGKDYINNGQ
jgi:hypothetical protein